METNVTNARSLEAKETMDGKRQRLFFSLPFLFSFFFFYDSSFFTLLFFSLYIQCTLTMGLLVSLISSCFHYISSFFFFSLCIVLLEMATIMNTGLDRETLSICVALCEAGVNPEALAAVIKELRAEARSQRNTTSAFSRS
ncbi:Mitotic-spindle organizing protein 1 [Coelomomyces lativittatus]|nr:Mitotic-spindle organizing protein 1 [Coelomomyces lativittatus]